MRKHPTSTDRKRWNKLRQKMLDAAGYRCRICHRPGKMELDHIIPIRQGGRWWSKRNLQIICKNCHFTKSCRENRTNCVEREAWEAIVATETVKMIQ